VREPVTAAGHADYLAGIGDDLAIYQDDVVHPGALLRMVNALLMRNVALGPWIHTGSRCRFLDVARWPATLRVDGAITETFERNGSWWVRYDALVRCDDVPVAEVDHAAIYHLAGVS
jgi:hypothetical protein